MTTVCGGWFSSSWPLIFDVILFIAQAYVLSPTWERRKVRGRFVDSRFHPHLTSPIKGEE
jgi:hypothetical protein